MNNTVENNTKEDKKPHYSRKRMALICDLSKATSKAIEDLRTQSGIDVFPSKTFSVLGDITKTMLDAVSETTGQDRDKIPFDYLSWLMRSFTKQPDENNEKY